MVNCSILFTLKRNETLLKFLLEKGKVCLYSLQWVSGSWGKKTTLFTRYIIAFISFLFFSMFFYEKFYFISFLSLRRTRVELVHAVAEVNQTRVRRTDLLSGSTGLINRAGKLWALAMQLTVHVAGIMAVTCPNPEGGGGVRCRGEFQTGGQLCTGG